MLLGRNVSFTETCRESHPVVRVDDVEVLFLYFFGRVAVEPTPLPRCTDQHIFGADVSFSGQELWSRRILS